MYGLAGYALGSICKSYAPCEDIFGRVWEGGMKKIFKTLGMKDRLVIKNFTKPGRPIFFDLYIAKGPSADDLTPSRSKQCFRLHTPTPTRM